MILQPLLGVSVNSDTRLYKTLLFYGSQRRCHIFTDVTKHCFGFSCLYLLATSPHQRYSNSVFEGGERASHQRVDDDDHDGTPSPGISSAITDTCTIITSTIAATTVDHAHTLTSVPHISTSTSLVQPQPDPASRSLSPTSSNPPAPPVTHESVKVLFDVTAFTSQNIETHLKSLSQYIAHYKKYGPTDTSFISTLNHILDIILPSLRKVANSPKFSEHDADRTLSHFHRFFLIAFTHLLAIPTVTIINTLEEVITLMFSIGQYDQRNRDVILGSKIIPAIFHHLPTQALDHLFSLLSSLSISNNDHVLVVVYMLSSLGQFSQLFSSKQCDIVLQWVTAAVSYEYKQDTTPTVRVGECLYWVSRQKFINDNGSNRVIHLKQFREFIEQLLPRSAEMPAILSFYVDLAKLDFVYASDLLEQVFVELGRDITYWDRYNAMEIKLEVIGDLVKLVVASTRFDKHTLLNRLQSILESDAVPFVAPTGRYTNDSDDVYKVWMTIRLPGVDNYQLILRKAVQLLANPLRDYTEEVSEFVSKKEHISDVHHCIFSIAKYHHHYEVPVPVQLIPHAINAICNPDIAPAAKEVVCQFLNSNLHNISLEPIAGVSMTLNVETVTSHRGISSILEYKLSPALSDNIITAINQILETRRDISVEARMNARSLLESLDQLGEALTRVYHHQHPPAETPPVPHLNYAFMKYCIPGTPSPGISSAITDTCTIITSTTAITTVDHAHTLTSVPHISTSTSLVQPQPDPASRSLSPTSSHPPPPPVTHESVKMLFDVTTFTSQNIETHLKPLSQYITHYNKYGPTDTSFVSTLNHILDIILPSLRKVANAPKCSEHDADRTLTDFHMFSLITFTHLLAIPTATIINTLQEVITLMFTIGQYDQRNKDVILGSKIIPAIFHHFPAKALDHLFSSLSSLSISNSDYVLVATYMLSGLGQFSQLFSSKQCDIVLQWITAALSNEFHQDANHTVRIGEYLFWVSRQKFINDNNSNSVIHLQQFREFIEQLLPRSAEMPAILSFYVDLAKLDFVYASDLLEQVFVELGREITNWSNFSAMTVKLKVIDDLAKLIVASTRFDKSILLNRLQSILESDAVPFVVSTSRYTNDNDDVYKVWMSVKVPGVDNYALILHKAAQLLANPLRDYTPELSQFVSTEKHINDVHHCIFSIAKYHHHYEVSVPVQLIPRAINAICNPEILPAAKKAVSQFLSSDLRNLSLEPIAGVSMTLDVQSVTSQHGISSILEYGLSSALSDNIIAAINHILETRRDISMEARMNARSLLESLDQLGEALTRVYHHQHPPTETPHLPPVSYAFMKYCIHECTNQVREQYGTGADNDVDLADDEDEDMEIDEGGDNDNNDATVRDDILDHSLFTKAIRIDQLLSSASVVPAYRHSRFRPQSLSNGAGVPTGYMGQLTAAVHLANPGAILHADDLPLHSSPPVSFRL
ncbi:hypothetical protein GQ42DRAFT_172928 [Ramicandelaber brevisporus]|nr:hypothetical protein GQ42DRAFT_172928 [Ramicandelaber brevisporus]